MENCPLNILTEGREIAKDSPKRMSVKILNIVHLKENLHILRAFYKT